MKRLVSLLFLLCLVFNSFSQLPQGDRILAWQVDLAENANYDSAFAYAQNACMESIHLASSWSSVEPDTGLFDQVYIGSTLDAMNLYYPIQGTRVELQLSTMNTVVKSTPNDLLGTDFDTPRMIDRFKTLLDTLFAHIPDVHLSALNIGNESDVFMGADAAQYTKYKTFLNAVVPYAKQLYFNLHGTDLNVGTTFTLHSLITQPIATYCQSVNSGLDIVSTTYYPLNGDFTMQNPSVVGTDFSDLVAQYSDTLQPIYFVECGYASSDSCNSSEALQAQFYENVFDAWDTHFDNIKYLTIFKSTDWSQSTVNTLGQFYGITDNTFLEYLRTLGVRTWPNDGINKAAYNKIRCELDARNWCSTTCSTLQVGNTLSPGELSVFPNPASNQVSIQSEEQITQFIIIDSKGKVAEIHAQNVFSIAHLPIGLYVLKVELSSGNILHERLVKY